MRSFGVTPFLNFFGVGEMGSSSVEINFSCDYFALDSKDELNCICGSSTTKEDCRY